MPEENRKRQSAKKVFVHYFNVLFKEADITMEADHRAELEYIVDDIIEAAKAEARAETEQLIKEAVDALAIAMSAIK